MFEDNEIINFILGLASIAIVYYEIKRHDIPDFRLFFGGLLVLLLARIFTVVEGVFWGDIFNILEHLCYALSAFLFVAGCISLVSHKTSRMQR